MRPLIGIVMRCSRLMMSSNSVQYSFDFVRRSVIEAGGEPFYLTPPIDIDYNNTKYEDFKEITDEEKRSIDFWLDSVNGLILPGGEKHTPYDIYILEEAIKKKIPVIGFCLGMQIMSLYKKDKDDLEKIDTEINHAIDDNTKLVHSIKIDKDSRLYKIIGKEEIMVNSYHEYSICENPYYRVVAKSPDGIIEAIEFKGDGFNMGVQWHPEKMYSVDKYSKMLIDEFMKEARKRKAILDDIRR